MTTEADVLRIPEIRFNSFVGDRDMGNFVELEKKYGLIFNCKSNNKVQGCMDTLMNMPALKAHWTEKRKQLLLDKIDFTTFMIRIVENYPGMFT